MIGLPPPLESWCCGGGGGGGGIDCCGCDCDCESPLVRKLALKALNRGEGGSFAAGDCSLKGSCIPEGEVEGRGGSGGALGLMLRGVSGAR